MRCAASAHHPATLPDHSPLQPRAPCLPLTLFAPAAPSFCRRTSLNSDMLPILTKIFSDDRLAGDHRDLPGAAPLSVGSFIVGFLWRASVALVLSIGNGEEAAHG